MARQTIAALAAACGLALILLPASVALAGSGSATTTTASVSSGSTSSSSGSGGSSAPSGKSTPAPAAKPKAAAPPTPPPVAKPAGGTLVASIPASKAGTPLPIILLAILGGLLLVIGLVVWVARFMGWGLDRWADTLQTLREAGYRSENAISEFADWARRRR